MKKLHFIQSCGGLFAVLAIPLLLLWIWGVPYMQQIFLTDLVLILAVLFIEKYLTIEDL